MSAMVVKLTDRLRGLSQAHRPAQKPLTSSQTGSEASFFSLATELLVTELLARLTHSLSGAGGAGGGAGGGAELLVVLSWWWC